MEGDFLVSASRLQYFMSDSYRVQSFRVNNMFSESIPTTGTLTYYLEGEEIDSSQDEKYAELVYSNFDSETGILSLQYKGLDIDCTIRLKLSPDHKSITLLNFSAEDLVKNSTAPNPISFVYLFTIPDTAAIVRTEQEMRDALENPNINKIYMGITEDYTAHIEFDSQLIIDRDIEFSNEGTRPKIEWQPSENWVDGEKALISIQNGANVRFISDRNQFIVDAGSQNIPLIEIKDSTLEMSGVTLYGHGLHSILSLENAVGRFYDCSIQGSKELTTGISMDMVDGSVSNLEIIGGEIQRVNKQIISGSPDSNVILPNGYTEFTNGEGQREWTNDPDKLPQPPEETENPQEPAETDSAVTE